jgi:manganese oxidase
MNTQISNPRRIGLVAAGLLLLASTGIGLAAPHLVNGLTGPKFDLVAAPGYLSTPEGNSLYFWGYGEKAAQYSGPTLIVNQDDEVTVTLVNNLPVKTSITFPGQSGVTAEGGSSGLLTQEAGAAGLDGTGGGSVTYKFKATQPGTFMYQSGTQPDLQIEMGMVGALIVRPTGFATDRRAYGHADSAFDHEYLFLLSDMDDKIHNAVELQVQAATTVPAAGLPIIVDMSIRFAVYWFMNGRCGPDTLLPANYNSLPVQPYDCFPLFHPGERILMRVIGAGSDEHPLHHHGNHARMIAQDGRLLQSPGGSGADLGNLEFTVPSTPGSTIDTLFSWTGAGLGWDAYGHTGTDAPALFEDPADHLKPFPVKLPAQQHLVDGMMYGGSPFLGTPGILPPGEGGFNNNNGFMYLWHSHAEKEIVNNDIFPGGMMTFALVEAWPAAAQPAAATATGAAAAKATRASASPQAVIVPQSLSARAAAVKARENATPQQSIKSVSY